MSLDSGRLFGRGCLAAGGRPNIAADGRAGGTSGGVRGHVRDGMRRGGARRVGGRGKPADVRDLPTGRPAGAGWERDSHYPRRHGVVDG